MDIDDIWNYFKNQTEKTIQKHIPTKLIRNKSRLPGVDYQLKKLINQKNKLQKMKKQNIKHSKAYQKVKAQLQKEMRNAYWKYICTQKI